jgi:hypothetical protein
MIVVHFNVYADFLAAVKELKPLHVFYEITAGGAFGAQAYVENKSLICGFFDTAAPASFSADFPLAISMAALPTLNQASGQQY